MARKLLLPFALLIGLTVVIAAAATLEVNGGALQVFSLEVDLPKPEPPPPPPGQSGTSLVAYKTAYGFKVGHGDGDGDDDSDHNDLDEDESHHSEDDAAGVRGTVCVTNSGDRATDGLLIVDTVQYKPKGGGQFQDFGDSVVVDLGNYSVLGPGEKHCYEYEITFEPIQDAIYRNTARVTITNHSGHLGEPFGPNPKDGFELDD